MFTGYLHCLKCEFKTRTFMWVHHPCRAHHVVFQHQTTFALRIQEFPDDDVFYRRDETAVEAYYQNLEQRHAKPGEKMVWMAGVEDGPTKFPCPKCLEKLHWHISGIA